MEYFNFRRVAKIIMDNSKVYKKPGNEEFFNSVFGQELIGRFYNGHAIDKSHISRVFNGIIELHDEILCFCDNEREAFDYLLPKCRALLNRSSDLPGMIEALVEQLDRDTKISPPHKQKKLLQYKPSDPYDLEETSKFLTKAILLSTTRPNADGSKPQKRKIAVSHIEMASRFHHSSKITKLYGRDDELKELYQFCGYNNSDGTLQKWQPDFLWWSITGAGGTGKSRLAGEFLEQMNKKKGWVVYCLHSNHQERLQAFTENPECHTLILIDYAATVLKEVAEWIEEHSHREFPYLIRVLLLERSNIDLYEQLQRYYQKSIHYICCNAYQNGKPMQLKPLDKEKALPKLIVEYCKHFGKKITKEMINNILTKLTEIDPMHSRTLLCMILCDAYVKEVDQTTWDSMRDALDFAYQNECVNITNRLRPHQTPDTIKAISTIIMIATMTSGLGDVEYYRTYFKEEWECLEETLRRAGNKSFFLDKGFTSETGQFYPLEPDLIGEFYVKEILQGLNQEQQSNYLGRAWLLSNPMQDFTSRFQSDFSDSSVDFQNITLPPGLTQIGDWAFFGCSSLELKELPPGLTQIGDWAFLGCSSLELKELPPDLTQIGDWAFDGCSSLKLKELPPDLTQIGDWAFDRCSSLKLKKLPSGLTEIGYSTFGKCSSLELKELPSGLTEIGDWAFVECSSLELRELPSGLTEIGDLVFYGCSRLELKILPPGLTEIGNLVFYGCSSLELKELPSGLTKIGKWAFGECSSLELKELPPCLKEIGEGAFDECSSLELKELPPGLTKIGKGAFYGCNGLELKELPPGLTEIGERAFYGCKGLELKKLPSGLTEIGKWAFGECSSLELKELPPGLTEIGDWAFYGYSVSVYI